MEQASSLLRAIPGMDLLLQHEAAQSLSAKSSPVLVARALREVLAGLRERILDGSGEMMSMEEIIKAAAALLSEEQQMKHRPVINATGVMLHTNLGRAPLAQAAADAVHQAALHYTNLEFDTDTGERGDRLSPILQLLRELTGAEDALVVNNNAAAMLLTLTALAQGREVVVSRGELVEIGGSFRVPEVMAQGGCTLREVGTTNKTKLHDYEQAITEQTAALMKVHTSNYQIIGFTQAVSMKELADLAHARGLPALFDLGSGAMLPLAPYGLPHEPTVQEALAQGADVVCFSGDKLLGGPQAGIILGKAEHLALMKKHPLMRALRVDKLVLAALEATLLLYQDEALARRELPLYRMLGEELESLRKRAEQLLLHLYPTCKQHCAIVPSSAQVGGGSAPGVNLPSLALAITPVGMGLNELYMKLISLDRPLVARVHQDRLLVDIRTLKDDQLLEVAHALQAILCKGEGEEP